MASLVANLVLGLLGVGVGLLGLAAIYGGLVLWNRRKEEPAPQEEAEEPESPPVSAADDW